MSCKLTAVLCAPANPAKATRKAESLGLRYLTAYGQAHGFKVSISDAHNWGWTVEKTVEHLISLKPSLIGLSLIFHEQIEGAKQIVDAVTAKLPNVFWIAGGHVATFAPRELLERIPQLKFVVRGEGEQVFVEALQLLQKNGNRYSPDLFRSLPGTTMGSPDFLTNPPPALIKNLDSLPFPSRDVSTVESNTLNTHFSIIGSRGCYARCDFCSVPPFFKEASGAAWRLRSADSLVAEMRYLRDELRATHVSFLDDIFLARDQRSRERALRLAELLLADHNEIRFSIECRADAVDFDIFSQLKRAGLSRVFVGIEAGSPETLEKFSKDCTLDANVQALKILRELKIPVTCGFILFHPDATLNEVISNILFIRSFGIASRKAICSKMDAYPGTPAWARLASQDRLWGDAIAPQYTFSDQTTAQVCGAFREVFEPLRDTDSELLRLEFELTRLVEEDCERLEKTRQNIKNSYSTAICDLALKIAESFSLRRNGRAKFSQDVSRIADDANTPLRELRHSMESLLGHNKN